MDSLTVKKKMNMQNHNIFMKKMHQWEYWKDSRASKSSLTTNQKLHSSIKNNVEWISKLKKDANWIVFALELNNEQHGSIPLRCLAKADQVIYIQLMQTWHHNAASSPPSCAACAALLLAVTPARSNVNTQGQIYLIHRPDSSTC